MVIFLLFLCAILTSSLVYPLLLLATNFQKIYSVTISSLILLIFIFLCARQFLRHGIKPALKFIIKLLVVLAGFTTSFYLVLEGKRIVALFSLILAIIFFITITHFFRASSKELASEQK